MGSLSRNVPRLRVGRLPKTGVTTSQRPGDDGDTQRGAEGSRWIVYESGERAGTVFDRHTGLLWPRAPHLMIPGDPVEAAGNMIQAERGYWSNSTSYVVGDCVVDGADPSGSVWVCLIDHTSQSSGDMVDDRTANPTYWRVTSWNEGGMVYPVLRSWQEAVDDCLALEYAGIGSGDWQLANADELVSLIDYSRASSPYMNTTVFPNAPGSGGSDYVYFWSATPFLVSSYAVMIRFTENRTHHCLPMTYVEYAWPVHYCTRY